MPPTTALDDDAIARLLAEDAHAASKRYVSQGLSALLPKRANGGAPKPNTRFLKNLVRDADSHNAALKRKEDQERRERQRRFAQHDEPEGRRQRDGEDGRERKRMRLDDKQEGNDTRHRRHRENRQSHKHSRRQRNTSSERSRSRSPDRLGQPRKQTNCRDRDESADRPTRTHSHRKHHGRRSRLTDRDPPAPPRHILSERQSRNTSSRRGPTPSRSSSSDPLEDLVGPLSVSKHEASTPRSRGRGANKQSTSAMDDHFSPTYDPALDMHPDSEDSAEKGDWDMALEAMKDRQEWKQKQADRMREAGFGDDEIRKWEDSGREKSAGDLKWRKAGEGREWDAGKEITAVDETFGRLSRKVDSDLMSSWKRKSGGFLKDIKSSNH